jgi:hypothetical protein
MTAERETPGDILCDVVDLLRGAIALIDSFEGRDRSDELLAARSLARLALNRAGEAQELNEQAGAEVAAAAESLAAGKTE